MKLLAALAVIMMLAAACTEPAVPETKEPKPTATPDLYGVTGDDRYSACNVVEKFVKARLKAPGSAKFQGCRDVNVTRDDKTWTLQGWVDAENAFSAKLRNTYTAVVFLESKDKVNTNWRLISLDIR